MLLSQWRNQGSEKCWCSSQVTQEEKKKPELGVRSLSTELCFNCYVSCIPTTSQHVTVGRPTLWQDHGWERAGGPEEAQDPLSRWRRVTVEAEDGQSSEESTAGNMGWREDRFQWGFCEDSNVFIMTSHTCSYPQVLARLCPGSRGSCVLQWLVLQD